jgi:hypothetical protein
MRGRSLLSRSRRRGFKRISRHCSERYVRDIFIVNLFLDEHLDLNSTTSMSVNPALKNKKSKKCVFACGKDLVALKTHPPREYRKSQRKKNFLRRRKSIFASCSQRRKKSGSFMPI